MRKSQKHDANLQKNSTLYFQVGLILCLLGTFALFEMQFESKDVDWRQPERDSDIAEYIMPDEIKVHQEEAPKEKKILKKRVIDEVNPIDNDTPDILLKTLITEPTPTPNPEIDHKTCLLYTSPSPRDS